MHDVEDQRPSSLASLVLLVDVCVTRIVTATRAYATTRRAYKVEARIDKSTCCLPELLIGILQFDTGRALGGGCRM